MHHIVKEMASKYEGLAAGYLSELIKRKSLSCQEADVQKEVMRQMRIEDFDEVRMDGLGNVIGRIGDGPVILAIDGHVDTVDIGNQENWDFDPLGGLIENGYVHGRGTIDQKGGIASFIVGGKILKELDLKDLTIYFVSSVMEEDCDGLCWKYIVEEGLVPHFVISTEPTNLNIYRGHRGRMEIEVEFFGVSSHGSAPERGVNAIYMASKAALEIEKLNDRLKTDDFLGQGSVCVTEMTTSSPSLCAVSDYAKIHLDRRLTWGETESMAVQEVASIVKDMNAKVKVLDYEEESITGIRYGMKKYYPTWKADLKDEIVEIAVDSYKKLYPNREPNIDKWTFSTNGVTIKGIYNIPTIGFGPGDEKLAHSPNEKIPISHLSEAAAFYASFAYELSEKYKTGKLCI